MPYETIAELPEAVRKLPQHAQEIYQAAFNSAWEQYEGEEPRCHAVAWAAVKRKYEKGADGKWHLKAGKSQQKIGGDSMPEDEETKQKEGGEQVNASPDKDELKNAALKEVWTAAEVNDLPDSAFLWIQPGGEKDEEGKTTPRALRHFPVMNQAGKLDLPHCRNAIARIPQSNAPGLTPEKKAALQEKARRLLEAANEAAGKSAGESAKMASPVDDSLQAALEEAKSALKEGRTLSAATRERLQSLVSTVRERLSDIEDLLNTADAEPAKAGILDGLLLGKSAEGSEVKDEALSLDEQAGRVRTAFELRYGGSRNQPVMGDFWPKDVFADHIIVCWNNEYWQVPYAEQKGEIVFTEQEKWVKVKQEWQAKSLAVKVLGSTADAWRVGNWGIIFGKKDLQDETFSKDTDLWLDKIPNRPTLYEHSLNEVMGLHAFKTVKEQVTDEGVWVESELLKSDAYAAMLMKVIESGKIGFSPGSAAHLIRRDAGKLKVWPVIEWSFTPTPAQPSTLGVRVLHSLAEAMPEMKAILPAEETQEAQEGKKPEMVNQSETKTEEVHTEEVTNMADINVEDIAKRAADEAVKAMWSKLEAEPPKPTGGVALPKSDGEAPYKSLGEFLLDVKRASSVPIPRLSGLDDDPSEEGCFNLTKALGPKAVGSLWGAQNYAIKAATGLSEESASGGGFLVETDRAAGIMARVYAVGDLLRRIRIAPLSAGANAMTFNAEDETSRADGYRRGGIRAYWGAEAGTKGAASPKFRQMELKLKKVYGLVYATDELLQDAAALEGWIMANLPEELRFVVEDSIINGLGGGVPKGILASTDTALISVAAEGGQAAASIVTENVVNMYSRMWTPGLRNAVWLVHQTVWPQLYTMYIAGGAGNVPVFLPPGGLSAAPYGTLMGLPVLASEYCQQLGTLGDILLVDLSQYQGIEKGGVQSASSIHVRFIYDETVFRFVYRFDGQPSWNSALTPAHGTTTVSPFVGLATRS